MPIAPLADSAYAWILGLSIVSLIPFIALIRKCTVGLAEGRKKKLNNVESESDTKSMVMEIFEIYHRFKRYESHITYSFWSFIGIVVSSISGMVCQYFGMDNLYALLPLTLSGIIFSINFISLLWWYVKH